MATEVISHDVRFPGGTDDVRAHVLSDYARGLSQFSFHVLDQGADRVVFRRRFLPPSGFWLGLLTFPIGIIFWATMRQEQVITFSLTPETSDQTRMLVAGQGTPEVRAWVERIRP